MVVGHLKCFTARGLYDQASLGVACRKGLVDGGTNQRATGTTNNLGFCRMTNPRQYTYTTTDDGTCAP